MNLSAIQLVQPRDTAPTTFVARLGRVALLYAAIAVTGATVVLVAFLLTWQNLAIAVVGLFVGLGAIHSVAAFVDVLTLLVRHMKAEFRAITRIMADLRAELRTWRSELRRREFIPDVTQPLPGPESVLRRYVLKYASATALLAPALFLLAHTSIVFLWSGLSGLILGIVVIVVDRVIFHVHGFDIRRKSRRTDVTSNR